MVVAAGPWSPELIDPTGAWRPIKPLWGVVVEVDLANPPGHVLEEVGIDVEGGIPTPHGVSGTRPRVQPRDGQRRQLARFDVPDLRAGSERDRAAPGRARRRYVPAIAKATVGASRACARPLSVDGRPLIGRVPGMEGLWIAAGHGPWGVSTGPDSGRLLADLLLGQLAEPPAALDPARFGAPPRAA